MQQAATSEEDAAAAAAKYQKLAGEYAKLRAKAVILRKAVIDERSKSAGLQDQLRQLDISQRRAEQEMDALLFRNKQLELRVGSLQQDIRDTAAKKDKTKKTLFGRSQNAAKSSSNSKATNDTGAFGDVSKQEALLFEDLQNKIIENAQLQSLIDDKTRELDLHCERIGKLEKQLEKRAVEQSDLEKRLRHEIEILQNRNTELETKLVEAASMLGSEDTLSATGSDYTPLHNVQMSLPNHVTAQVANNTAPTHAHEERLAHLEKEVSHWRAQYELAKLNESFSNKESKEMSALKKQQQQQQTQFNAMQLDVGCDCSSTAAGLTVKPSTLESRNGQSARNAMPEPAAPASKEQRIFNNFSKKYEDLLKAKCMAESRVSTYETEVQHLQHCLENATYELKCKDEQLQSLNKAMQMTEEDLATTRINYEEQISVLTEQVISLSEQLAASN